MDEAIRSGTIIAAARLAAGSSVLILSTRWKRTAVPRVAAPKSQVCDWSVRLIKIQLFDIGFESPTLRPYAYRYLGLDLRRW
jgi:hypothetical protein